MIKSFIHKGLQKFSSTGKTSGIQSKPSIYNPAHPGEILNTQGSITPEMALRLELAFRKPSADHWLRLQCAHDLWQTRQHQESIHVMPYKAAHVA